MQNKIAVEEHYDLPPITAAGKNAFRQSYLDDVQDRLHNRDARLREMDAFGIGYSVMSLTEPGIQGLVNASETIELAKRANNHVYECYISAYPTRRFLFGLRRHGDVDQRVLDDRDHRRSAQPAGIGEGGQDNDCDDRRQVASETFRRHAHCADHHLETDKLQRDIGHGRYDTGDRNCERKPLVAVGRSRRR
jgi:hypothetical protein